MAEKKPSNLRIWDRVCETDPAATREVHHRGGFTTIDAYSQIEMATRVFGPVGTGWWWDFNEPVFLNDCVIVKCSVFYVDPDTGQQCAAPVQQFGQKALTFKSRPDEDALKKAGTDALTKCLSYLGFNADVFLGKFDDNKYVAEQRLKFGPQVVTELANLITNAANMEELAAAGHAIADTELSQQDSDALRERYRARARELQPSEEEEK